MAGRPREFDKDHALKQAMLLFWARGYEGTSMSALVEALGIASARIYAAFGSKEQLFREAVALYEASDGGFADRALREQAVRPAIERMLHDAVLTYTKRGRAQGCLVVSAATSTAPENEAVMDWLAEHRRQRTSRSSRGCSRLPPPANWPMARTCRHWATTSPPCCTAFPPRPATAPVVPACWPR